MPPTGGCWRSIGPWPPNRSRASPRRCRPIVRCWSTTIPGRSISTSSAKRFSRWRNGRYRLRQRRRRWRIPVAYGGEHGIDLEDVAKTLNTTPDEIVARHVAGDYRVAMIGFTPGWSYLSGLDRYPAHAAAAESAAADAGRHHLDRRRADRRAMPRRPERLAPAGTHRRFAPTSCIATRSSCWSRATTSPLRRSMPGPSRNRIAPPKPANSSPS